jgi:4-amino-4-deoxy-L-arabinose transferase-like glycosyltransferase
VRRPALFLLLLCFLTFFFGLGRAAISDSDEAFYAESSREMVERGDWLTPHYNYQYRWQKPVLYYWLTAITYVVVGVSEWAARAWSALAGAGLAFVTYAAGRRITGHDEVGWLAGAIAATCFGYVVMARLALPDLPLAFFVSLTITSAFERRWLLAGLASGLGFLTKGPVALVLAGLVLVPVWWMERPTFRVSIADLAKGFAVFAVIGLPWFGTMTATHGMEYLRSFFLADNVERFTTERFNESRSMFFYVPIVLGGMLPWTGYLLCAPRTGIMEIVRGPRHLSAAEWRLLFWAGMPLLFFTLSIGKQPRYVLPLLPPLAILLARSIAHRIERARNGERSSRRDLYVSTIATAVILTALAALLVRARDLFITAYPALTWMGVGVLFASAAVLAAVARLQAWERLPVVLATCAALALLATQFGAFAGVRPEPVERMAALVAQHRTALESVGEYQVFVRNLIFYSRFSQTELFAEDQAVHFMRSPERVLMVVRDIDLPHLEMLSGVAMRRLGQVRYVNTANLKLRQLLQPMPEDDVQTVLLVANR